jgi:hypothetical protein
MLYEPPKTKRYILIGASAVVLAVLVIVAAPLIYRSKTNQAPVANLLPQGRVQQQKIQKELDKLETMRKSMNIKEPTQEEIQKELAELERQRSESNITSPTPEQIQAELDNLKKMRK